MAGNDRWDFAKRLSGSNHRPERVSGSICPAVFLDHGGSGSQVHAPQPGLRPGLVEQPWRRDTRPRAPGRRPVSGCAQRWSSQPTGSGLTEKSFGDKPMATWEGTYANPDSDLSGYPNPGVFGYTTQAARGQGYAARAN